VEGTAGNFEGAPTTIMEGTQSSSLLSSMTERRQSSSPCGAVATGRTTPAIKGACRQHRLRRHHHRIPDNAEEEEDNDKDGEDDNCVL
jgi:hypothetical protein